MKVFVSLTLAIVLFPVIGLTQCCSGGVPIASNIGGLPSGEAKTLQILLNYDLNVLNTLKFETEVLDDDSRNRKTHSMLLNMAYSFNEKFSIEGLLTWVRQERTIRQFGNENFSKTQGIGDAVLLLKYRLLSFQDNKTNLTGGLGVKFPVGSSERRLNGFALSADLQPGSGAWDGILWGQINHITAFRPTMSISTTFTYTVKGTNNDYLPVRVNGELLGQSYRFGREAQIIVSVSDRLFVGNKGIIDPGLSFRYRGIQRDKNGNQFVEKPDIEVPSTGGRWVFIKPSLSYWFTPDFSMNGNVELPLYARAFDTQVTPTYRINIGFYYKINFSKKTIFIDPLN